MQNIRKEARDYCFPRPVGRIYFMKTVVLGLLLFVFCIPACSESYKAAGTIDVYFSPHGGASDAIVREIVSARSEILVQAYSFTSAPIAKALIDARKRGVKVEVVLDKSQRREKYTSADFLAHGGIDTSIDSRHAIAHNKIMVIDRMTLITGSFNFTRAAEERNAENLLVIRNNGPLANRYVLNFVEHRNHAESYRGR